MHPLAKCVRTIAREKGYRVEERSYGEFWVHTPEGVIWYKRDGRIAQVLGLALGPATEIQNEAVRRSQCR